MVKSGHGYISQESRFYAPLEVGRALVVLAGGKRPMDEKIPLFVALIALNEAENLPDCRSSVAFARQRGAASAAPLDTLPVERVQAVLRVALSA
jgi:hypothetical protein